MKRICTFGAVAALAAAGGLQAAGLASSRPPNVLLIISDDQGFGDFAFNGNPDVKTPNLDMLASQSAVFRNFVVAPACSPTRASIMTGRNHLKTGVWGVGPRNNLMTDEALMPHYFTAAGYATGYFGKRDGLSQNDIQPYHHCDEAESVLGYVHRNPTMTTREGLVRKKGWTCDIDVDNALDFIKRHQDQPWWCGVAFILPHLPWVADQKFVQPYRDAGLSEKLSAVYGCISQMDDAVGRLLKGVADLGQADRTLVIFLSDNGPVFKELTDADAARRNVRSLRGAKAEAWDNGIRVPLLARFPGRIPPGERVQFGSCEDILPTMMDFIGLPESKWPKHLPLDGVSLCPQMENPSAPEADRPVFRVAISGPGMAGGKDWVVNDPDGVTIDEQHVALRGERFKFHSLMGGRTELYDLKNDPGETKDVSAQFPEIVARYAAELNRQYGDILATKRPYRMSTFKVGEDGFEMNKVDGASPQKVLGRVKAVGFEGVTGFRRKGDAAEYAVNVAKAGRYQVRVVGRELDKAGSWSIQIGEQKLSPAKIAPDRVDFGEIELKAGSDRILVETSGTVGDGSANPALVEKIFFKPALP